MPRSLTLAVLVLAASAAVAQPPPPTGRTRLTFADGRTMDVPDRDQQRQELERLKATKLDPPRPWSSSLWWFVGLKAVVLISYWLWRLANAPDTSARTNPPPKPRAVPPQQGMRLP